VLDTDDPAYAKDLTQRRRDVLRAEQPRWCTTRPAGQQAATRTAPPDPAGTQDPLDTLNPSHPVGSDSE